MGTMPLPRQRRSHRKSPTDDPAVRFSPSATALVASDDLVILDANRSFAELLGQALPQLKRSTLLHAIHADDRDLVRARLDDLAAGQVSDVRETVRLVRNGAAALLLAKPLRRGKRGSIVIQLVDVSDIMVTTDDRIQLLDAIERAAWEWRRTFDAVEMPIVILGTELFVARINRAARMLAGRNYNEIIGQPISRFADAEPWTSIAEISAKVQEDRAPSARQVKDAAGRTLDLLAMLFNADDPSDKRVIVIVWDVTTLVDLQTRYEQQRTMAAIGTLVAGVAHEVRNPLFAISATLDAMEQFASGDMREYFDVLREEIDRMSSLMRDLLAYGRPAAPTFAEVPVNSIVADAVRNSSVLAQKQNVTIQNNVAEERSVVADRERLARAFQNLIDNSIQHSGPGSVVAIEAMTRPRGKSRCVQIRVTDQGEGFRPAEIPRVFEPFFSKRKGGTGLGLALVQQIVAEHGGEVVANNAAAGGAEVTITLPLAR